MSELVRISYAHADEPTYYLGREYVNMKIFEILVDGYNNIKLEETDDESLDRFVGITPYSISCTYCSDQLYKDSLEGIARTKKILKYAFRKARHSSIVNEHTFPLIMNTSSKLVSLNTFTEINILGEIFFTHGAFRSYKTNLGQPVSQEYVTNIISMLYHVDPKLDAMFSNKTPFILNCPLRYILSIASEAIEITALRAIIDSIAEKLDFVGYEGPDLQYYINFSTATIELLKVRFPPIIKEIMLAAKNPAIPKGGMAWIYMTPVPQCVSSDYMPYFNDKCGDWLLKGAGVLLIKWFYSLVTFYSRVCEIASKDIYPIFKDSSQRPILEIEETRYIVDEMFWWGAFSEIPSLTIEKLHFITDPV